MSSDKASDPGSSSGNAVNPALPDRQSQLALTQKQQSMRDMQYKCAIGGLIAGPVLILMPPRKLDWYTFGLCWLTVFSANHIIKDHGHPGIIYAISPNFLSDEYKQKAIDARKPYEGMMPSEAIWKQLTDVWNQRYDDEPRKQQEGEEDIPKDGSILDAIRKEESKKPHSEVLQMLAEQEKKRKS